MTEPSPSDPSPSGAPSATGRRRRLRAALAGALHVPLTALLTVVCYPSALWLVVTADEIEQESGRAAAAGAGYADWGVALIMGAPAVLLIGGAAVGVVVLLRRTRLPAWRVAVVATFVSSAAVMPALWLRGVGSQTADVVTTASQVAAVGAAAAVVAGAVVVVVATWRAGAPRRAKV